MTESVDICMVGDCRKIMRQLIARGTKVQTIVTSPPYWSLRDYGVVGQIGIESTPLRYLARIRSVFRLVRELLADDGTLWLNMGDCYYTRRVNGGIGNNSKINGKGSHNAFREASRARRRSSIDGLKEKDMLGLPWLVALMLRADGWYLRSDIIWHKPNPMPESVGDRPTKAHEYIFLLTKSVRYYYDSEAIKEPVTGNSHDRGKGVNQKAAGYRDNGVGFGHGQDATIRNRGRVRQNESFSRAVSGLVESRSRRSVWTVATEPYSGDHFATFPRKLIEPCILAGSRPGDIVFDPFMGAGTVAAVAASLGRRWLGCELNPKYAAMVNPRSAQRGLSL